VRKHFARLLPPFEKCKCQDWVMATGSQASNVVGQEHASLLRPRFWTGPQREMVSGKKRPDSEQSSKHAPLASPP